MNCWHCDRPSHGACFFCGRGVCKEHARTMPGLLTLFRDRGDSLRGMVVDTVLWCGVCNPKRYPVNLDVIDPAPMIEVGRLAAGPPSPAETATQMMSPNDLIPASDSSESIPRAVLDDAVNGDDEEPQS